ncbi:fucolectin-like [Pleurodeles waltl]|uniref:fucolectin-like n=1 Tax=Pleurodeles waltl TaxID=8319 RepID=UPI0037093981
MFCLLSGENVALGGRATQSSVLFKNGNGEDFLSDAINAIDGNQDANFFHGSCSHTDAEYNPWWRVDLLRPYRVNAIAITTRDTFHERLMGAEILIGNSLSNHGNSNARCAYISGIAAGATQTFHCQGLVGRYVNVIIRGRRESLTLCEVQVFAEPESHVIQGSIDTFEKCMIQEFHRIDKKKQVGYKNLKKEKIQAIEERRSMQNIVIKQSDKGGNVHQCNTGTLAPRCKGACVADRIDSAEISAAVSFQLRPSDKAIVGDSEEGGSSI